MPRLGFQEPAGLNGREAESVGNAQSMARHMGTKKNHYLTHVSDPLSCLERSSHSFCLTVLASRRTMIPWHWRT
jgi:hypothetical protein